MTEPKPARPEDLPKATHEGEAMLFGVKVRTYKLDDGRSVIHADDFHKLIEAMFSDAPHDRQPSLSVPDASTPAQRLPE